MRNNGNSVEFFLFGNRRGSSTVEYIFILVGILAVALILSSFMANDGQSMLKDKIMAIINGDVAGEKSEPSSTEKTQGSEPQKAAPEKREQAKSVGEVRVTDEQLRQISKISYDDVGKLEADDFNDIFGLDEFGKPNAEVIDHRDLPNGFQAIAVKDKSTGEVVIAFRGSDTEDMAIDWWGQDATIWTQTPGVQEFNAKEFVESVKKDPRVKDSSIVLTGHSLGGYHAQIAAKETGLPAVTYNAPGLKPNPGGALGGLRKLKEGVKGAFNPRMNAIDDIKNATGAHDDQVVNYVNEGDPIGNFGIHYGKTVVTGKGKKPKERNDYTSPFSVGEGGALNRARKGMKKGGFGQIGDEHGLGSFDGQYDKNGNISR